LGRAALAITARTAARRTSRSGSFSWHRHRPHSRRACSRRLESGSHRNRFRCACQARAVAPALVPRDHPSHRPHPRQSGGPTLNAFVPFAMPTPVSRQPCSIVDDRQLLAPSIRAISSTWHFETDSISSDPLGLQTQLRCHHLGIQLVANGAACRIAIPHGLGPPLPKCRRPPIRADLVPFNRRRPLDTLLSLCPASAPRPSARAFSPSAAEPASPNSTASLETLLLEYTSWSLASGSFA